MLRYVTISITDKSGKLLKHFYIKANKYGLPSGKIEEGETAVDAGIRELLERTGYWINKSDLHEIKTIGETIYFKGEKEKLIKIANPGEKGGYSTNIKWE